MTMTPGSATRASLNAQVAAEVRAEMGRRGMSNAELARLLGVSEAWTTRRLGKRADTALNLVDLQRIAAALNTPLATFFTAQIRDVIPSAIPRYMGLPVRIETHMDRPRDNRPAGKAGPSHPIGAARTSYVGRRPRGRQD